MLLSVLPNRRIVELTETFRHLAAAKSSTRNFLAATTDFVNIQGTSSSSSSTILILMAASPTTSTSSVAAAAATVAATAATSAVMGMIAGYYYRSVTSFTDNQLKTLKVPASLLRSKYSDELKLAVQLAMEGAFGSDANREKAILNVTFKMYGLYWCSISLRLHFSMLSGMKLY
mmetsp:Transcript_21393/g.44007  ORF Transcript_21393/g.44007 Transcript_21393/m.44007 type:complete len:174 (+) Transcript_21393:61-582(+)